MKKGLIISDAGPIFSLALIDHLDLLHEFFDEILIPTAVWNEITKEEHTSHHDTILNFFQGRVKQINRSNHLSFIMDYGESEAVILYEEQDADFLLIDDKKARKIAENLGVKCIGTLGILVKARTSGIIDELKPLFEYFISNHRYYSLELLNQILDKFDEAMMNKT